MHLGMHAHKSACLCQCICIGLVGGGCVHISESTVLYDHCAVSVYVDIYYSFSIVFVIILTSSNSRINTALH